MKRILVCAVFVLILNSCLPKTVEDIDKSLWLGKYTFKTDVDFQKVYRVMLNNARNCYQGSPPILGIFTATTIVESEIDASNNSANIVIANYNNLFPETAGKKVSIEIVKLLESETRENKNRVIIKYINSILIALTPVCLSLRWGRGLTFLYSFIICGVILDNCVLPKKGVNLLKQSSIPCAYLSERCNRT